MLASTEQQYIAHRGRHHLVSSHVHCREQVTSIQSNDSAEDIAENGGAVKTATRGRISKSAQGENEHTAGIKSMCTIRGGSSTAGGHAAGRSREPVLRNVYERVRKQ